MKTNPTRWFVGLAGMSLVGACLITGLAQNPPTSQEDAVVGGQTSNQAASMRPEQTKTDHDRSGIFSATNAQPASEVAREQPKGGRITGFDFYRDPLNSDQPNMNPDDIVKKETANKPNVSRAQRELLERRYVLEAKTDPSAKMSRGKPLQSVARSGASSISTLETPFAVPVVGAAACAAFSISVAVS